MRRERRGDIILLVILRSNNYSFCFSIYHIYMVYIIYIFIYNIYLRNTNIFKFEMSFERRENLTLPSTHTTAFPSQQIWCKFLISMDSLAISEKLALGCFLVNRTNSLGGEKCIFKFLDSILSKISPSSMSNQKNRTTFINVGWR